MKSSVDQVEDGRVEGPEVESRQLASAGPRGVPIAPARLSPHAIPGLKHGWLSRLRSYFILDPLIWLYTLVMGVLAIPGGLFDRSGRRLHWFSYRWSWLIMKTISSPVKVTGLDKIDTAKPHVYAVNHASALDIPVLYTHLPFQFRIAFKKELLSYPVVGWQLKRSGQVCIDQQNPSHSISSIRAALKGLKAGTAASHLSRGRTYARWRDQTVSGGSVLSGDQGASGYRSSRVGGDVRTPADEHLPYQVPPAGDAGGRAHLDHWANHEGSGIAFRAGAEGGRGFVLQLSLPIASPDRY